MIQESQVQNDVLTRRIGYASSQALGHNTCAVPIPNLIYKHQIKHKFSYIFTEKIRNKTRIPDNAR